MNRYCLEFSYLGTEFFGYQIQPNARTVQACLEEKLSLLAKTTVSLVGSSRTDTGVHARQQFAHFDLEQALSSDWVHRLNRMLPKDLAVKAIYEVSQDFHARFDASARRYSYTIAQEKDVFSQGQAYWFELPLEVDAMNAAAQLLLNHRDFECFSKVHTDVFTFDCDIHLAHWEQKNGQVVFHIAANRFLRGMVRAIVGTLLEVGAGKSSLADVQAILDSKDRGEAGRAVPAHGLCLEEVNYPESLIFSKVSA